MVSGKTLVKTDPDQARLIVNRNQGKEAVAIIATITAAEVVDELPEGVEGVGAEEEGDHSTS